MVIKMQERHCLTDFKTCPREKLVNRARREVKLTKVNR